MHLLFVTSLVPDGDPATGYEIANAAIIAALRRAGARVTILGFTWPGKRPSEPDETIVLGEVDVRTEGAPATRKVMWLAEAVMRGMTFSSAKLRAVTPDAIRSAMAQAGPFDGYVLNAVQFAGAYEHLFTDRPSIFVAHNVEYLSAEENAETVANLFQRTLFRREARILRGVEKRLCGNAAFVFTLAEDDRKVLGVDGDDRSAVLALTTRSLAAEPTPRTITCDAALIGTWTWQPNRVGLEWYLDEVVPLLPGDFHTRIAGHIPSGLRVPDSGVELVGRVPDAVAFVRSAAVVPLIARAGTGVQLKTIETFELGLPAVATSRSLRGIAHLPQNCTVADDPKRFAEVLVRTSRERSEDADGRAFHRSQTERLDTAIRRGLDALSRAARIRAA